MSCLGAANSARTEKSRKTLNEALRQETFDDAMAIWGGSTSAFWKAAKRYGRREEAKAKFARPRTPNIAGEDRLTRDELIEDAEFLAQTGESQDGAARRMGFKSWDSLYTRLSNYDRLDIADRISRNGQPAGWVHQGTIRSSTNGARL